MSGNILNTSYHLVLMKPSVKLLLQTEKDPNIIIKTPDFLIKKVILSISKAGGMALVSLILSQELSQLRDFQI